MAGNRSNSVGWKRVTTRSMDEPAGREGAGRGRGGGRARTAGRGDTAGSDL